MDESPLINKILSNMEELINTQAKVSNFITSIKSGVFQSIQKIQKIPIPINDIEDRIAWKFTSDGDFSVKTAAWANNESSRPHQKLSSLLEN